MEKETERCTEADRKKSQFLPDGSKFSWEEAKFSQGQ